MPSTPLPNDTPRIFEDFSWSDLDYMQLFKPNEVATAVKTVIKNWMMLLHVFFFIVLQI